MFKEYLRKGYYACKILELKPIYTPLISSLSPQSPCLSLSHRAYLSPNLIVISDTLSYPDPKSVNATPVQAIN